MESTEKTSDILKSKSLKSLIKGSLVILGLFIVLYCGIDILLLLFSKKFEYNLCKLIIFLVSPIIALFCFFCSVNKMSYWFKGDKNDDKTFNAKNTKLIINVCNIIIKALNANLVKKDESFKNMIIEILEQYFNINLKGLKNNNERIKQNINYGLCSKYAKRKKYFLKRK